MRKAPAPKTRVSKNMTKKRFESPGSGYFIKEGTEVTEKGIPVVKMTWLNRPNSEQSDFSFGTAKKTNEQN